MSTSPQPPPSDQKQRKRPPGAAAGVKPITPLVRSNAVPLMASSSA
ncbi:hypothetical protein [Cohnella rhizosphaerae]|uniref:Uncharacterized protein n=1 Tax=Cohnella rhizosphaerae TaxID=1457232 RepID=A0A9X4L0J9_9BACL|nr:hypothetical protein [Cohnella rhizosphaerae]MDG0814340.1 hypothetical protein [Cohnella rhizosphaerae]